MKSCLVTNTNLPIYHRLIKNILHQLLINLLDECALHSAYTLCAGIICIAGKRSFKILLFIFYVGEFYVHSNGKAVERCLIVALNGNRRSDVVGYLAFKIQISAAGNNSEIGLRSENIFQRFGE